MAALTEHVKAGEGAIFTSSRKKNTVTRLSCCCANSSTHTRPEHDAACLEVDVTCVSTELGEKRKAWRGPTVPRPELAARERKHPGDAARRARVTSTDRRSVRGRQGSSGRKRLPATTQHCREVAILKA